MTNSKTNKDFIHLTVSNMGSSLKFYREVLGFQVTQMFSGVVFLSAGGYHHHIRLNTWASEDPQHPQKGM